MAQPMTPGVSGLDMSADRPAYKSTPAYQAFQILHAGFTIAPIVAGLDKFFHLLVNWDQYLAPLVTRILPGHTFMLAVGAIEVVAGLLVAFRPKIGGYIVSAWLLGIVGNLLLHPGSFDGAGWGLDIALRDFGLSLGALALARLATHYEKEGQRA